VKIGENVGVVIRKQFDEFQAESLAPLAASSSRANKNLNFSAAAHVASSLNI